MLNSQPACQDGRRISRWHQQRWPSQEPAPSSHGVGRRDFAATSPSRSRVTSRTAKRRRTSARSPICARLITREPDSDREVNARKTTRNRQRASTPPIPTNGSASKRNILVRRFWLLILLRTFRFPAPSPPFRGRGDSTDERAQKY